MSKSGAFDRTPLWFWNPLGRGLSNDREREQETEKGYGGLAIVL